MNLREDELHYVLENGILDEDTIRMNIDMATKKQYLEMHEYRIWQSDNDNYWRTYLPDEEKGRKLIKKSSLESLEKEVISYYRKHNTLEIEKKLKSNITLYQLFPEWIDVKRLHTNSTSNIKRICALWKQFYESDKELIDTPMKSLTKVYLDNWIHKKIQDNNMKKSDYYRMSLILRQCMEYAFEQGYISDNVFSKVKVNNKMFVREKKKPSETQVFTDNEVERLISEMRRRFKKRPSNTAPLAIILNFELGLRIGELVAIKKSDIKNGYIHIQRQEVKCFVTKDEYDMKKAGYKVVDYTKTLDGDREIPLTESAQCIIDQILQVNKEHGHSCEGYLFVDGNKRMTHYSIERRLARGCESIGIPIKSSHKIRKTVISSMIDAGMNIDDIRRIVGHADERTTYNCYCYSRNTKQETKMQLEGALNYGRVIKSNQTIIDFPQRKKLRKATN